MVDQTAEPKSLPMAMPLALRSNLLFGLPERETATRGREMKAAIVPSANSNWEVKETKIPEPSENQVLIKIRASGMCYTDVHQTRGESPGDFPRMLGHEPVGEIVRIDALSKD
jgi:hypothetical protein